MKPLARTKSHALRAILGLVLAAMLAVGCSASEPAQPSESSTEATPGAAASPGSSEAAESDGEDADSVADETEPTGPTLADASLASVQDFGPGVQVEDEQGNLLAVYGFVEWPGAFEELSDEVQSGFPFFGDVQELIDPAVELIALDVGMCSAGIDSTGFGTAEFFLHDALDDALSTDPVLDRGVLARHPVVQPGFSLPRTAECARGWLPVLWSGDEPPRTARYVLTTRPSTDADVEQHVYQWDLEALELDLDLDRQPGAELFGAGQTVTFNSGLLAETTVVVEGFAELIGADAPLDGTRLVAVSLEFCPASAQLPEFGLSVDGWNLIAPVAESDLLGATVSADPSQECFEGWLEFAVPHGGVPTGFFISDGLSSTRGYAEWSLEGAALPGPA